MTESKTNRNKYKIHLKQKDKLEDEELGRRKQKKMRKEKERKTMCKQTKMKKEYTEKKKNINMLEP